MVGEVHSLPALQNFIGGRIDTPVVPRGNSLRNPNDLQPLQAQLSCDDTQVERALVAAAAADRGGDWENTPAEVRADVLEAIAARLSAPELRERMAVADAEALALANGTDYGLAAYVFSGSEQHACTSPANCARAASRSTATTCCH